MDGFCDVRALAELLSNQQNEYEDFDDKQQVNSKPSKFTYLYFLTLMCFWFLI